MINVACTPICTSTRDKIPLHASGDILRNSRLGRKRKPTRKMGNQV